MKRKWGILAAGVFFCLTLTAQADLADLLAYFANPNWGDDPGEPDTLFIFCINETQNQQIFQFHYKTDNMNDGDSVVGMYIPLIITTDQPGVTLDTTIAATYAGTVLADWPYLAVSVFGGPDQFPMQLVIGGHFFGTGTQMGAGEHIVANLTFSIAQPCEICVDTDSSFHLGYPVHVVTEFAIDYVPQWREACCGPVVPTLSQWGLIIFALILLSGLIYFIHSRRVPTQA